MKVFKKIAGLYRHVFLSSRFFLAGLVIIALFAISFAFSFLFIIAQIALLLFAVEVCLDAILLFIDKDPFRSERKTTSLLSLGDDNMIYVKVQNITGKKWKIQVVDELPYQLQIRNLQFNFFIAPDSTEEISYAIHPTERGAYHFGDINIYAQTRLGLLTRKVVIEQKQDIPVYPSIIQMKHFELMLMERIAHFYGVKKLKRIGQSYEFEQIKSYIKGDDYRKINWKATGKTSTLQVNHYVEERSQQVYCILDKSRNMKMPFNGLSLLDYAINTALVISNTALHKQDNVGLMTFSNKIDTLVKASNKMIQLKKIMDSLYKEKENYIESNYELLYASIRRTLNTRSLLFLFTNFESLYNMRRNIHILRRLGKQHLLVVIFFENTEITQFLQTTATTVKDIYDQTIAEKFAFEKQQIIHELRRYGIHVLYTKPEDLTINTLNKYLEIKARGLI